MDIETLQIKRVKGNWSTHKGKKLEDGELAVIDAGVVAPASPRYLAIGNGTSTLEQLVDDDATRTLLMFKEDVDKALISFYGNLWPENDPSAIVRSYDNPDANLKGNGVKFARDDHTHKIKVQDIETELMSGRVLSGLSFRRVGIGTSDPASFNPSRHNGQSQLGVGDIYIKI